MMAADVPLAWLRTDAVRRAPHPPGLDDLIEDAGRQRLAAYYLYSALLAGVIGDDGMVPARWPPELAEPMRRLGLTRFAPRTGRGLDTQLTPAEQATRRRSGRQFEFAQLLVDLINQGAFGPLCGDADRVRLAKPGDGRPLDLELIKRWRIVSGCPVKDHWELVAQYLAGAPLGGPLAETGSTRGSESNGGTAAEGEDHRSRVLRPGAVTSTGRPASFPRRRSPSPRRSVAPRPAMGDAAVSANRASGEVRYIATGPASLRAGCARIR